MLPPGVSAVLGVAPEPVKRAKQHQPDRKVRLIRLLVKTMRLSALTVSGQPKSA
jgi:hypothetical protein